MQEHRSHVYLARYITIAVDIATRIVRGEYRLGQKIFGRSTLAGKYNVSPETIRRALTLLQERGIVDVMPGVGVVVKSDAAAREYLADYNQKKVLLDIQERLTELLKEREKLNTEIDHLTNQLLDYTFKMAGRLQKLEEVTVPPQSPLLGKSMAEADFRARTGATILSIYRNGHEMVSPEAKTTLQAGDVLLIVGTHDSARMVYQMVTGEDTPAETQDLQGVNLYQNSDV
ncbi:TrkA C-terminal domain-containing protein [Desulfallas thermosapovorans]|uniref:Regulatory GntR family protein n=1 Tax=Desulfallas thermosapovorans DSM 6562 TaxID=1121431 RepID=A0A5S4ZWQ5_9FIRM|nr:TrkA C-terminal domain-containing protein [Desulfallas thermosapovorans]TYO97386.1 regulatory GntR family protein [Desulfallas thermosapovorans DSM 6562]